jgi:hypothetical protein
MRMSREMLRRGTVGKRKGGKASGREECEGVEDEKVGRRIISFTANDWIFHLITQRPFFGHHFSREQNIYTNCSTGPFKNTEQYTTKTLVLRLTPQNQLLYNQGLHTKTLFKTWAQARYISTIILC